MAGYEPPTGESLSGYELIGRSSWDLWEGSQESESVVVRRWEVTASPSEVADDLASALETNGWIIESEDRSEDAIYFVTGKHFTGYCAKALVSAEDTALGGRAAIRLSAPYSGAAHDGCSDEETFGTGTGHRDRSNAARVRQWFVPADENPNEPEFDSFTESSPIHPGVISTSMTRY